MEKKYIQGFYQKYSKVEDLFAINLKEHGIITKATFEQDINEHWDLKLTSHDDSEISIKFDVKAVKKINRNDSQTNENIHWIELFNVLGKMGWLYGDADYFAFETDDYFIVVEKMRLQSLIADKCAEKIKTEKPELYKLYQRNGRKDMITLVKTIDLCFIANLILDKRILL